MTFYVVTLFPELIRSVFEHGVVAGAAKSGVLTLHTINPREFTSDVHHTVDARPYGGGDGMVMMYQPLKRAVDHASSLGAQGPRVYLTPQGERWTDRLARELAAEPDVTLICGRYAGVDQRFVELEVDREISIGDYVLSGGELPAAVLMDSVARYRPGVLGNSVSPLRESFAGNGHLECPAVTRPRDVQKLPVPEILLSGHHQRIEQFQSSVSLLRTYFLRRDLWKGQLSEILEAQQFLRQIPVVELQSVGIPAAWLNLT